MKPINRINKSNSAMKTKIFIITCCIFASFSVFSQKKALVGGTLIDGFGGKPIYNSVILIDGEKIVGVGHQGNLPVPTGYQIISTEGMSVMPGLWDMHVHLMINGHSDYTHWDSTYIDKFEKVIMPSSAHQLLMAGVTSARDLGAPLDASINVRNRINKGEIPGPTMYMSGPFLQHKPYPGKVPVSFTPTSFGQSNSHGSPTITSTASAPPTPIASMPRPPALGVCESVPIMSPPGNA